MLVNRLMYLDDLVLLSPSAAGLSMLMSICSTYGIECDVTYNSTKSNVLVFRSKLLKNVHVPEFEINNTAIDIVSMYKYLGHCINDELSDDDDMTRQGTKVYAQGNALIRKFYIYTTKIDGVVCPPNISETVAGRLMKLAHRQRIASTTIKLIFKKCTVHFINFI